MRPIRWSTIGETCDLLTGGTPDTSKREYYEEGTINWISSGEVNKKHIWSCEKKITELGVVNSNARLLPKNSVLIALNGVGKTRGTVAMLHIEATCNQSVVSISPKSKDQLLPEFLFHFLDGSYQAIRDITGDKDRRGLNMPLIRQIEIPLPPPDEQRRIVAILDEAFAAIATATLNAEKNLANAQEIFGRELNAIFSCSNRDWPIARLEGVSDFQGGSQPPKSIFVDVPREGYIRLLQIRDFKTDKYKVYVPISSRNKLCNEDDIMIGRYGASVGQIHRGKAGAYNVALIKSIPNLSKIDREFFYYYLRSETFQGALKGVAARSAQAGFSKEDIAGFPIPLPQLNEQKKVASSVGELASAVSDLSAIYERKKEVLSELRKSLLQRALLGQLTSSPFPILETAAE